MTTDQLIGKSAGKICFTNFNQYGYYWNQAQEEAQVIWESGRSEWTFLSQDMNGTTRWLSPDESQVAMLIGDGEIHLETIN